MMRTLARLLRCRSGSMAIEFSMVSFLFIMLSVGVIEFGRALHMRNTISHAIDHGARLLLLDPTASDAALTAAIRDALASGLVNGDTESMTITISTETMASGMVRNVVVDYPVVLIVPGLTDPITMSLERRVPVIPVAS